jgi:ornithine--oxo-acid transaminase
LIPPNLNNDTPNPTHNNNNTLIGHPQQTDANMAPHASNATTDVSKSDLKPTAATFQPVGALAESKYHSTSTATAIQTEEKYAAHNYHPLPIVFARAQGSHVWDPEGRKYIDCLSAYSAVNQGHCHPELVKALCEQASRLTLSSRAFYNDVFPKWAEKVQSVFGYDMVLPMNTGAEAVETAIKIARKWGYKSKKIEQGKALVFSVAENFHGRTVSRTSPKNRACTLTYL